MFSNEQKKVLTTISIIFLLGIITNFFLKDYIPADITKILTEKRKYYTSNINYKNYKNEQLIVVRIEGAVKNPGWYTIKYGTKLFDLIYKAGGFLYADRKKIKTNPILVNMEKYFVSKQQQN